MTISTGQYQAARRSVLAIFFAMGVGIIAAATRFAEIKAQIGTNDAVFGYALAFGTLGGISGNALSRKLVAHFSTRRIVLIGATAMPITVAGFGYAPNPQVLASLSFLTAMFYASSNIAVNAQGVDIQSHLDRAVMPSFHAAWSLGALTSSTLGNLAANFLSPAQHLTLNASAAILIVWVLGRNLLHLDPNAHLDDSPSRMTSVVHRLLFMMALTMSFGIIAEVSSNDWSAIHLHEALGIPLGLNGIGVTAFLLAQLTARTLGNRLTDRFGSYRLVRIGGLIGGGFYAAAILITPALPKPLQLPVVLLAIVLLGLGVAAVPAAVMGAVGRVSGISTARAMSTLLLYNSLIFLILRPLVSTGMEVLGTTITLALTGISLMLATEFSKVIRRPSIAL